MDEKQIEERRLADRRKVPEGFVENERRKAWDRRRAADEVRPRYAPPVYYRASIPDAVDNAGSFDVETLRALLPEIARNIDAMQSQMDELGNKLWVSRTYRWEQADVVLRILTDAMNDPKTAPYVRAQLGYATTALAAEIKSDPSAVTLLFTQQ